MKRVRLLPCIIALLLIAASCKGKPSSDEGDPMGGMATAPPAPSATRTPPRTMQPTPAVEAAPRPPVQAPGAALSPAAKNAIASLDVLVANQRAFIVFLKRIQTLADLQKAQDELGRRNIEMM